MQKKNISYRLGTPVNERLYIFRVLRTSHKLSKRFEYYALVSYLSNFFSIVCVFFIFGWIGIFAKLKMNEV